MLPARLVGPPRRRALGVCFLIGRRAPMMPGRLPSPTLAWLRLGRQTGAVASKILLSRGRARGRGVWYNPAKARPKPAPRQSSRCPFAVPLVGRASTFGDPTQARPLCSRRGARAPS